MEPTQQPDVIVVGAGLAGLTCANRLLQARTPFLLLEASDGVGGRVRTDRLDGFTLDRGFQIYLTAYPEAGRQLDYERLDFRKFARGALVRFGGKFHRVADPLASPLRAALSLFNPVGTARDKLNVGRLALKVQAGPLEKVWEKNERLTLDLLRWDGNLGERIIDRFFRPFLGGVFLERELVTSSRQFRFVFRSFAAGDAVVPAAGIEAIPRQIADRLPADSVRLNTPVTAVRDGSVTLASGETLAARAVVVATEAPAAAKLLGEPELAGKPPRSVVGMYFAADRPPVNEPILVLNGDGTGPVNNLVEMSTVAPSYAPAGKTLVSLSVLGDPAADDAALEADVRRQLADWFGRDVSGWRHLRTYRIPYAQPDQTAGALDPPRRPVRLRPGVFVCGDHRDNASIDGAVASGWRCGQAVLEELAEKG